MQSIKEILASASPEVIQKIKSIIDTKDDTKLKEYLDSLLDKTPDTKVESSVKQKVVALKLKDKEQVLSYFNVADYDWMRFKGKKSKRIPYNGMILKVEPEDVFGIAKVVDLYGNYKCILPSYKRQSVSLDPIIVGLIKSKCRPFSGDISSVMKASKERAPDKIVKAATYNDFSGYKKIVNINTEFYNQILDGINFVRKNASNLIKNNAETQLSKTFEDFKKGFKKLAYDISEDVEKASEDGSLKDSDRSKIMNMVDYLVGNIDSDKKLKTF